jgi:hypothetical protein
MTHTSRRSRRLPEKTLQHIQQGLPCRNLAFPHHGGYVVVIFLRGPERARGGAAKMGLGYWTLD